MPGAVDSAGLDELDAERPPDDAEVLQLPRAERAGCVVWRRQTGVRPGCCLTARTWALEVLVRASCPSLTRLRTCHLSSPSPFHHDWASRRAMSATTPPIANP